MDPKEKRNQAEELFKQTSLHPSALMLSMPKYKCHKEVRALKIAEVSETLPPHSLGAGGKVLTPEETKYGHIYVDKTYMDINPKLTAGGYFVVYKDGYQSYSPAKQFEEGYEKIS